MNESQLPVATTSPGLDTVAYGGKSISTFVDRVLANTYLTAFLIFVLTRPVALIGAYQGITNLIAAEPERNKGWPIELGLMWDSGWYAGIALNGYTYEAGGLGNTNVAFAPLFPFLTRTLASILHPLSFGWDFGN